MDTRLISAVYIDKSSNKHFHNAVHGHLFHRWLKKKKKTYPIFAGCYTVSVYECVHKCVCLHLGVMICEIIYCPSELEPLRSSSLLSEPVIPPQPAHEAPKTNSSEATHA